MILFIKKKKIALQGRVSLASGWTAEGAGWRGRVRSGARPSNAGREPGGMWGGEGELREGCELGYSARSLSGRTEAVSRSCPETSTVFSPHISLHFGTGGWARRGSERSGAPMRIRCRRRPEARGGASARQGQRAVGRRLGRDRG